MSANAQVRTVAVHSCPRPVTSQCAIEGRGKGRARCPGCGAEHMVSQVHVTVQVWRGDGRYTLATATKVCASFPQAARIIAADTTKTLVLRTVLHHPGGER